MFDKIKARFTKHLIEREVQKQIRIKKAINLDSSKKIGILFNLNDEKVLTWVYDFINKLTDDGKIVRAICYLPEKKVPDYYLTKLKVDLIQPHDLNFFGIPGSPRVKDFIKNEFDLLLDLSLKDEPALDYLIVMSKAGFKVGRYRKSMIKVFDLMIRKKEDMDFKDYYKSLLQYLSKIK